MQLKHSFGKYHPVFPKISSRVFWGHPVNYEGYYVYTLQIKKKTMLICKECL